MQFKPSHGRPYGGRSWFIKKNKFNNISVEFFNDRISIITFNRFDNLFALIGVYLPFFNSTNINNFEFETSLILINNISDSYFNKNHTVIVLGDFNCDINRNNKFDTLFKSFIPNNHFQLIDNSPLNNSEYTFSNSAYSYFIDHILIYNNKTISEFCSYVEHSEINLSDHDPIFTKLCFKNSRRSSNIITNNHKSETVYLRPNLENVEINEYYQQLVDLLITDRFNYTNVDFMTKNNIINNWYDIICNSILTAYDTLSLKIKKNKQLNNNYWFTDELKSIKKEIINTRHNFNLDNNNKKNNN